MNESGVIPYWGSCGYWREVVRRLLTGTEAEQPQGHALTRVRLFDGTLLSVPVEGGYRRLRHRLPASELATLRLSDHGRWQHVHPGLLKARYGRSPFFAHYFPAIERAYSEANSPGLFSHFTAALAALVTPLLTPEALEPFLTLRDRKPRLFSELVQERLPTAPDEVAILHPLFNLGPELPFILLEDV